MEIVACVPARGTVDVELAAEQHVVLEDGRAAALHVVRIERGPAHEAVRRLLTPAAASV